MKRIIHYNQIIPQYNDKHEKTGTEKIFLSVSSDNDKDFDEQLDTVKGYCDDWTIEIDEDSAIQHTKDWLDSELNKGLIWKDNKKYSITKEKQAFLEAKLLMGTLRIQDGEAPENVILSWNESGEAFTKWTYPQLRELVVDIHEKVEALVMKQQIAENIIKRVDTNDEIEAVIKDFQ